MSLADEVRGLRVALERATGTGPPDPARTQRPLRRLSTATLIAAVPGLGALFRREVPGEFVSKTDDDATVRCTCGEQVTVARYQLTECTCGRWFANTGETVRVWRPG